MLIALQGQISITIVLERVWVDNTFHTRFEKVQVVGIASERRTEVRRTSALLDTKFRRAIRFHL
jgi:hypothetical protein